MKTKIITIFLIVCNLLFLTNKLYALFYKELNLITGYSSKENWVNQNGTLKNSIGFEFYKKYSNEYGDFLTADIQIRTSYIENEEKLALEIHNFWLDYKLGLGSFLKVGHFDVPFGLESILDTHSTILQTLAISNFGYKKDWGISYRNFFKDFDYEISATIGSGMSFRRKDDSFLTSLRVANSENQNLKYGLSFAYGEMISSNQSYTIPTPNIISDKNIRKKRIGLDFIWYLYVLEIKNEIIYGKDDSKNIGGFLNELKYVFPKNQNLDFKIQNQYFDKSEKYQEINLTSVLSYKLNSDITLRLAYLHDLETNSEKKDKRILFQIYFFGE